MKRTRPKKYRPSQVLGTSKRLETLAPPETGRARKPDQERFSPAVLQSLNTPNSRNSADPNELFGPMSRFTGVALLSFMALLVYVPQVHAARPAMALDGFWSMCPNPLTRYCPSPSTIASLTTTQDDDVIVLVAQSKGGSNMVTSVADNDGHIWILRTVISGPNPVWEYYAIANSRLSSDIVNVTWREDVPRFGYDAFIVFGVSGVNTHNPWVPKFPVEITGWDGSSVALSVAGAGDFVIVSTAVNDAPPCFTTTNILPFQTIGEIGDGVYGEADYFIKGIGGRTTVSFSCNPNSDPMTFLGDALRGPGSQ